MSTAIENPFVQHQEQLDGSPVILPFMGTEERPANFRQRLLGAFVIFQLIAIPLGSYIKLVPVRFTEYHGEMNGDLQTRLPDDVVAKEPAQSMKDTVASFINRWGELTGQSQCWALFASFGVQSAMPAVELQWPDREPVTIRCYFEPQNPSKYFYAPEPCCRLFNYEYRTVIYYWASRPNDYTSDPEKYRRDSMQIAFDQRRSTTTYLKWKTQHYLSAHPDMPAPEIIVLKARISPDPSPGMSKVDRPPTYEVPVARWIPSSGDYTVWDPVAKQFSGEMR